MNSGDVDEISGDGSTSPDVAAGSRLERFAADARVVFDAHVLSRLDGGDLAMLALVSRSLRDVVFDSPVGDVKDLAAVRRELGRMPNFVGSVGRLAWAKDQRGFPWDSRTFTCITRGGNVEVARWRRERRKRTRPSSRARRVTRRDDSTRAFLCCSRVALTGTLKGARVGRFAFQNFRPLIVNLRSASLKNNHR